MVSKDVAVKKQKVEEDDLPEEDLALKEQLELYVERAQDSDPVLQKTALEGMKTEIRTATSSMTSVPKPLKFLRPHYQALKDYYATMPDSDIKKLLADILSVLAVTMGVEGGNESLKFRLEGSHEFIELEGREYASNLDGEVAREFENREGLDQRKTFEELMPIVEELVAFHMENNGAVEAVDLLTTIDELGFLCNFTDTENFSRTCLYLESYAKYVSEPEDAIVLDMAYVIYMKYEDFPRALKIALSLDDFSYVKRIFVECEDLLMLKQFCYVLARHGGSFELDEEMCEDDEEREELQEILNNAKLSEGYLALARDIDVMEAKSPEDIYKSHLIDGVSNAAANVDSARQNLAATFVNAFVNAGFGQDKLMTDQPSESNSSSTTNWLYKNKDHGKTSAAASLGMIMLWDIDSGLAHIDRYLHSPDPFVTAGALLGVGIVNCRVKNECDPALALLAEYVGKEDSSVRIGAIMGLALAYAGSKNEQIRDMLVPILADSNAALEVRVFTAISLGMVYVGSCDEEIAQSMIFALMERSEAELKDPLVKLLPLGLGMLYLGKQENVEGTLEVAKTFSKKIQKHCHATLLSCAYAGTGDVLKVQELLRQCARHVGNSEEDNQGPAILGIAMVAMSEELGAEMAIRSLEHLLHYGDKDARKAVPLALGLICISNPKVNVIDTLSRLSHGSDTEVAMSAVISLGLIGAGTNNARIAGLLRSLSSYYYKEANMLFCVRIAQGLVHLGKGLMSLSPFHADRFLLSPTAMVGLVTMLHACLNMKAVVLGKYHFVLYFLVLAMQPRMLMTVDENLKPLPVTVRVGQAVDVVGQAGRPKTITGFQTHTTPVLLSAGDRAELATGKYIPLSPVLEGFVILKEDPSYMED